MKTTLALCWTQKEENKTTQSSQSLFPSRHPLKTQIPGVLRLSERNFHVIVFYFVSFIFILHYYFSEIP